MSFHPTTVPVNTSRLIYGTMNLQGLERAPAVRLIHVAIDQGLTVLDTAPLYGLGAVEEHIGQALRESPNRALVATKCGIRWDADHGDVLFESTTAGERRVFRRNSRPDSIREEVCRSLQRLRVETLDCVQLHQFDPLVPLSETLGELQRMKTEGKLRAIGVSNFPMTALENSAKHLGDVGLFSVQDEYSALARAAAQRSLAFARANGSQFWAYSPLAQGLLTGRWLDGTSPKDYRSTTPRFSADSRARLARVLEGPALQIAARSGLTLGQLSLNWVLGQPGVSSAIVGGSTEAQIIENAAALAKTPSSDDLAEFEGALLRAGVVDLSGGFTSRLRKKLRSIWAKFR